MASSIPGKLLQVKVNGIAFRCQTNATLTGTVNMTENDPCKPSDSDITAGVTTTWVTRTANTKDLTLTMSAQAFADAIAGSQYDIAAIFFGGNVVVQWQFLSSVAQKDFPLGFLASGTGILNGFTFNAPEAGAANYDITISNTGTPTFVTIPVTT